MFKDYTGHAISPNRKLRVPGAGPAKHSLTNLRYQLDLYFILQDKDPCLLK